MKTCIITLMTLLVAGSLATADPVKRVDSSVNSTNTHLLPRDHVNLVTPQPEPANQINGHKFTYSGIAVQAIKTKPVVQMINPLAPAEYGSGHENLDRDVMTGKPTGAFKFFSFSF